MIEVAPALEDHPEDLLDLASRAPLTRAQRHVMNEHLAVCPPCAMQMRMARRARLAARSTAQTLSSNPRAVARAIERAQRLGWRRSALGRKRALFGLGVLFLSSGAFAASWLAVRGTPDTPALASRASVVAVTPRSGSPASDRLESAEEPLVEPAAAPRTLRARTDLQTARGLFARARDLRLGGDSDGALKIYRKLQRDYAETRESHLSYLVVGRLWLERGRPDLAVRQFTQYLERGGAAVEEALAGRATALGRLDRRSDEMADLNRILRDFPTSVYGNRARARLEELGHAADRSAPSPALPEPRQRRF
jgi:tetratricopeptide (TPR) repeat protein